jgi:hypothetical protein
MGIPRFEILTGVVDGVNTTFFTPVAYTPGSLAVFVNGQLKRADYNDGWIEANPATGEVTLKEAPRPCPPDLDEVIQAFFIDTTPLDTGFLELEGILDDTSEVTGLLEIDELEGIIDDTAEVFGTVETETEISGQVDVPEEILGTIHVCT